MVLLLVVLPYVLHERVEFLGLNSHLSEHNYTYALYYPKILA
jgi:hypothetical protein